APPLDLPICGRGGNSMHCCTGWRDTSSNPSSDEIARDRLTLRCSAAEISAHHIRMAQHHLRRAFRDGAAVVEYVNPVGEIGDHLHIVLDPDHRDSEIVLDPQNETRQILALL